GVGDGSAGICYTRTGRHFFGDGALETELLDRVRAAATGAGLWDELATDWLCLDTEILPWSVKAQDLLKNQCAAVGTAGRAALAEAVAALGQANARGEGTVDAL